MISVVTAGFKRL